MVGLILSKCRRDPYSCYSWEICRLLDMMILM